MRLLKQEGGHDDGANNKKNANSEINEEALTAASSLQPSSGRIEYENVTGKRK